MDKERMLNKIKEYEDAHFKSISDDYKVKLKNNRSQQLSYTVTYYCRVTLVLCCNGPNEYFIE